MRSLFHLILLVLMALVGAHITSAQINVLTLGTVVIGEVNAIQPTIAYSFDGREGDAIYFYIIPMQSDQQFYGRLFDANRNLLIETGSFPLIYNFVLPATQTYTLLIGNADDETGVFQLLVDFYRPEPLTFGQTVSGVLASNVHLGFYTLDVIADTLFRYTSTANSLGISILDPNDELVVFTGTYESPSLILGRFTQTGQHLLIISTDIATGVDFSLLLDRVEPISLNVGVPVTGTGLVGTPPIFSFQSPAGKAWELNAVMPPNGDRRMFIAQLDDRPYWDMIIASDSGSGVDGNPRITPFIAPIDATYYVWLEFSPYDDVREYDYEISLKAATILNLAHDVELAHTITPQTGAQTFVYNATTENERIELTIRRVSPTGVIQLQVISPEAEMIYLYGFGFNGGTFDLNLPVAGMYRFVIYDAAYEPTELQITIRLRQLQNK